MDFSKKTKNELIELLEYALKVSNKALGEDIQLESQNNSSTPFYRIGNFKGNMICINKILKGEEL